VTSNTRTPDPRRPSWIQRLLVAILPPRLAAELEAESRAWQLRCEKCGFEQSIWEIGGVRWKAAGTPRPLRTCDRCGQRSWHRIQKRPPSAM
jgi:hypothetical protein